MKIVFVGGHHISALVLARYLRKKGHQIYWLGTRYPRWPEKTEGREYQEVKEAGFPFFELKTGKFHHNFKSWWLIPFGFFQALFLLLKLKPDLIMAFGGYLAIPVVMGGWFLRIPSLTHEQTRTAGLANRFLQFFVQKVLLTWPESAKFFKKNKTVVVGLPLREEILKATKAKVFKNNLPTILVVGGRQGAHILNLTIKEILSRLLSNYNLIHQTGEILAGKDYADFQKLKESLPQFLKKRFIFKKFFVAQEMARVLKNADLVISRAGAHIVYELAYLGKPAIFIPLPFAFAKEQEENAKFFTQNKAGMMIEQKKLTGEFLFLQIQKMMTNLESYQERAQKLKKMIEIDALRKIELILQKNNV